jgi:hypothetical protein
LVSNVSDEHRLSRGWIATRHVARYSKCRRSVVGELYWSAERSRRIAEGRFRGIFGSGSEFSDLILRLFFTLIVFESGRIVENVYVLIAFD